MVVYSIAAQISHTPGSSGSLSRGTLYMLLQLKRNVLGSMLVFFAQE